jgi:hypothetical protein
MGTPEGGKAAAEKNTKKNPQFYSVIGSMGGRKRTEATSRKGFGSNRERASQAGKVGGAISRRTPVLA